MAVQAQSLASYFDSETAKVLRACTACGKCVEVCPVVPYAGLKECDPKTVAHSVIDFLAHRSPLTGASATFAHACNGCGVCVRSLASIVLASTSILRGLTPSGHAGMHSPHPLHACAKVAEAPVSGER